MGIKTVPQPPYSPDLAPYDFWLFPKLRGCHYETIEEMKEAVTKVIDMLTQEDFHGALQKLLKSWKQHSAKEQLYGHLPFISKNIQVRQITYAEHSRSSKAKLICNLLQ